MMNDDPKKHFITAFFNTQCIKFSDVIFNEDMIDFLHKNRYYESKTFAKDVIDSTYNEFKEYSENYYSELHLVCSSNNECNNTTSVA